MILSPSALFVGFAVGFFFGNFTALIKYIITAVVHWTRG